MNKAELIAKLKADGCNINEMSLEIEGIRYVGSHGKLHTLFPNLMMLQDAGIVRVLPTQGRGYYTAILTREGQEIFYTKQNNNQSN